MEISATRRTQTVAVEAGTNTATSTPFLMADFAGGCLVVSGVTATATLALFGSSDGVQFAPLYNADGQAATCAVAATGGAIEMPDSCYPLRYVKLVADNQLGTAASVVVALKS